MFKYPLNFNYIEMLTIFKFWWIFLFVEGVDLLLSLEQLNRNNLISFIIIFELKLYISIYIVLVHKNYDKLQNVKTIQRFAGVLTTQILSVLSVVPNIYQKNFIKWDSVMCLFSNMSTWNVLFERMIIFSPIIGISGIRHIFQTGGDRCLL